jgi:hypothetical protein
LFPGRRARFAALAGAAATTAGCREKAGTLCLGDQLALPVVYLGHYQIGVCQHASIVGRQRWPAIGSGCVSCPPG